MVAPYFIRKTENILLSSLGTVFTHGLVGDDGLGLTPAGSFGETRIVLRVAGAGSYAFVSLSNSVTVTIQASGNAIQADIICQRYHSIMA